MNFLPKLRRRPSQRLLKEGLETGNGLGHIDSGLHASKRSKHPSRFGPALLLFIKSQRNKDIRRAQRGLSNFEGRTPIIRVVRPSKEIVLRRIPGSPPKRLFQ